MFLIGVVMGKEVDTQRATELARLFSGEHGVLLFSRAPLSDSYTIDPAARWEAILAVYGDGSIYHEGNYQPQFVSEGEVREHLHFPRAIALREASAAVHLGTHNPPVGLKRWTWETAVAATQPLGLPATFVTWQHPRNKPKLAVLWYHGATQGQWSLAIMKEILRKKRTG